MSMIFEKKERSLLLILVVLIIEARGLTIDRHVLV
jgi:hypothetical protein